MHAPIRFRVPRVLIILQILRHNPVSAFQESLDDQSFCQHLNFYALTFLENIGLGGALNQVGHNGQFAYFAHLYHSINSEEMELR